MFRILFMLTLFATPPSFGEGGLKQQLSHSIYRIDRGSAEYLKIFGHPLRKALHKLGPGAHVVDFGAGDGHFILQMSGLEESSTSVPATTPLHLTAITFETDIRSRLASLEKKAAQPNVEVLQGRLFNEIPLSELEKRFGPVDLGVDVWGVLAYTHAPREDLRKIYQWMKPGAKYFLTQSTDREGRPKSMVDGISFDQFLETRLQGFDVKVDVRRRTLILTRNSRPFSFPQLQYVRLTDHRESVPVRRMFHEIAPN